MPDHEIRGNIHMHTTYSDGAGSFDDLVRAAAKAGLDFIYVTDHNVLVREAEEGLRHGVLTLVGQEVHDPARTPQRNHLLCLGVDADVSAHAAHPQALIDAVLAQPQGAAFLAHPIEDPNPLFPDRFDWVNWEVTGYTGIELWNYMARFKSYATSPLRAIFTGFFPHFFTQGPLPSMLAKWDELCQERPVVALGGTDVHAKRIRVGLFQRLFLPYLHCAQALNTHILLDRPLIRRPESVATDRAALLDGLRAGHCWIGYDLAGPTAGFRFTARGPGAQQPALCMGDSVAWTGAPLHLEAISPQPAHIRLLRDGKVVAQVQSTRLEHSAEGPGVYRVEVWKHRWGKPRGWIFSNPIYVRGAGGEGRDADPGGAEAG